MTYKLLTTIIISSLIVLPILTGAEENQRSTSTRNKADQVKQTIENRKETIGDKIADKKEDIKNTIEERKNNAIEQIRERLNKFTTNVIARFEAAVDRLEKLATRIESRIAKLDAESIDTTKAKELLLVAKSKIEIAKTSIGTISLNRQASTTTASSTNSINRDALKRFFEITKTQIEKAKTDIKVAHAALVDVINNLKPGQNKDKNERSATSTTPTATSTTN